MRLKYSCIISVTNPLFKSCNCMMTWSCLHEVTDTDGRTCNDCSQRLSSSDTYPKLPLLLYTVFLLESGCSFLVQLNKNWKVGVIFLMVGTWDTKLTHVLNAMSVCPQFLSPEMFGGFRWNLAKKALQRLSGDVCLIEAFSDFVFVTYFWNFGQYQVPLVTPCIVVWGGL
jgi:hypothetical protein